MLSRVWLFATLGTIDSQAPMSMEFFRQEYWSRLPFPPPGHLPDPGFELTSASTAWQEDSLPLSHQRSPFRAPPHTHTNYIQYPPTICKTDPVAMKDPKLLQPFRVFWPRDFRVTSPRHISHWNQSLISLPHLGVFLPSSPSGCWPCTAISGKLFTPLGRKRASSLSLFKFCLIRFIVKYCHLIVLSLISSEVLELNIDNLDSTTPASDLRNNTAVILEVLFNLLGLPW